ncbi:hypothetical protein D9V29_14585 [Mycetocola manganoxydans]|uniref:Uncharacterized protein n=1 Tax=Mycetocola manganoxydans TaxID=699879 RepID=A0A3L6ZJ03_9MICO|nr:hypothetical protein [Mycetocola manganoxydans]RLP67853.1 hypothetical protein D9V29_14585 [Mycetocola manganoxydans]GHD51394.1 hypothetical protein GCM10008097_26280 [Mycetocola manganoxydans]
MSNNPDAAAGGHGPATRTRLVALVCFAGGLLVVLGGMFLALRWLLASDVVALLVGLLLILLGVAATVTGVVLFFRGIASTTRASGKTRGTL